MLFHLAERCRAKPLRRCLNTVVCLNASARSVPAQEAAIGLDSEVSEIEAPARSSPAPEEGARRLGPER